MGERMGLRGRKRKRSGFVEYPRSVNRMKRGGRNGWAGQSSELSGFKGRGFSSNNKPYGYEAVDRDYMRLLQPACVEPEEEMDADFVQFMRDVGSLEARMSRSSRRCKLVGEGIEAGEYTDNGEASRKKKKKKKCCRGFHKWKKNTPTGSSGDFHGDAVEESLDEDILGESSDGEYEMFLGHVKEEGDSYVVSIPMGHGKWSSFSYEAVDLGTWKGYAKKEGRKGNGGVNCLNAGRGGVCTRSKFRLNRKRSPVVGRKTMNETTVGLSCGKTLRNNQGGQWKTSVANSSLGNENVFGESLGDDTLCVNNVTVDEPLAVPGVNNVTVDEPLDGEYEMFLEHLTVHETSYMLNVTAGDGKSISFLYGAEDCSTREGFAKGEGSDDLQPKKRRRDEDCISSKVRVDQQKSDVVGRKPINKTKVGWRSGMGIKTCQSNLLTSDANSSSGFRTNDAYNFTLESLDGEYEMFLEHLTVHENSYMFDVTTGNGKNISFLYGATDEDFPCKKRRNEGRLMELPNCDDALRTEEERGMEARRDLSEQGMETLNPEIAVSTVNKARLMQLPNGDDTLRTKKETAMEAYRDVSPQGMETLIGRNDTERSEGMNLSIYRDQSADKGPEIENLDSIKQQCEEEVGGCQDQVDKCLNLQMENLIADEDAIKEEEVDPTSSADSDDIVIVIDPATFSHDNNTPFLPTEDPQLYVVQYDDEEDDPTVRSDHSEFRSKLMEILRQPYCDEEYDKLWAEVSRPRQKQFDEDMPRSSRDKHSHGMSYLDQHKDFAKKIAEVQTRPDLENRRSRMMNLLRGFVYLMQNLPAVGAFKPWADKLCLEVLPSLRCDGEAN
ncbi:unnamed protein product [Linum tenue]|uniref:Uncharacterized protein n=1 Tax=Linum tenue TaxID=586396 RepID=A0AAV0PBI6_9ROSI|nr:unnamed protein product [Linum tenue]